MPIWQPLERNRVKWNQNGPILFSLFNPLTGNLLSRDMAKLLKLTSNGRSYYVEKLKKGEIVGVAVGGVEEACFDFDYNTEWGSRTGFANVALEAGKDIKILY